MFYNTFVNLYQRLRQVQPGTSVCRNTHTYICTYIHLHIFIYLLHMYIPLYILQHVHEFAASTSTTPARDFAYRKTHTYICSYIHLFLLMFFFFPSTRIFAHFTIGFLTTHMYIVQNRREFKPSTSTTPAGNFRYPVGTPVFCCTSVLRCVAVCCSMLQCVAACCSMLQYVAACCSMLQYVAACCSKLQCDAVCCSMLQCVAMCCSVLQYVAVCCSVLQCVLQEESFWAVSLSC